LSPSPAKAAATRLGLPVTDRIAEVLDSGAEVGVVVAYGRLIKPPVLGSVPFLNVHFSLLPRWRGAAPVERAILAGDEETGVCLMSLEAGLDTGPVHARASVVIEEGETAAELTERLGVLGTSLLLDNLARWPESLGAAVEQAGEATYAAKIDPAELEINWLRPAVELDRLVRVGGAWTTWRGRRLLVGRARLVDTGIDQPPGTLAGSLVASGSGSLELIEVQGEGRAPQAFASWANGARLVPGDRFGS
jgi:methionyl-tRNA formyltransferase